MAHEVPAAPLTESSALADPLAQFTAWFDAAKAAKVPQPNAMVLATATATGAPSTRVVLLKDHDARGFVFFTNYSSRKSKELHENARVALLFFWSTLERQIRIEGIADRTSREESESYFRTRPRGAQIGAWASAQSTVVTRGELDRRVGELEAEYDGREVPVPPFWGGFRVAPTVYEFWQGRDHRLHDRLRYVKEGSTFRIERLAP